MRYAFAGLAIFSAGLVHASGYNIGTQSVSSQSTANANGAEALDASVIYANPAGMLNLQGTQISGVLNLVMPDVKFEQRGTAFANLAGNFVPMTGTNGGDAFENAIIPHFYISHRLNEDVAVGFGVFAPFGANADFSDDFVGRYYTMKTELTTINFNPSVAFRVNDKTTLGVGLNAQYMDGKLARKVYGPSIVGGITTNLVNASLLTPVQASAITNGAVVANATTNQDAHFGVEGDSWGYGFNIGLMHHFSDDTRVGLAYRSRVRQSVEGEARLTDLENVKTYMSGAGIPQIALDAIATEANGRVNLDTPESASLNVFHQLDPKWAIMADITWTGHDRLQQIAVEAQPVTTTYLQTDWESTFKFSLGASWEASDRFHFRFGYMFDQSPVPSAEKTLTTLPDNDRQWFSLGGVYRLSDSSTLDFAYSYIHIRDRDIERSYDSSEIDNVPDNDRPPFDPLTNTPGSSSGLVAGTFSSQAHIIGVQYNQQF